MLRRALDGKDDLGEARRAASDLWRSISDTLRQMRNGVRSRWSRPAKRPAGPPEADPYAITRADLDGGLRRVLGGEMGPPGYAMGRVLAGLFRAKGYRIAAGCGTGGPGDGPEGRAGAWLVCERDGRRKAVMCRLYAEGRKAGREDVAKLAKAGLEAGASSGLLVSDSGFAPECEEERQLERRMDLEFWDLGRAVSEMRQHLAERGA